MKNFFKNLFRRKMTKEQLLDETVEYYKTNPRAATKNSCYYQTPDGHMCAIGRLLKNPAEIEKKFAGWGVDTISGLKKHLKPEYKHFVVGDNHPFLTKLQTLHDHRGHWKPNLRGGYYLTEEGEQFCQSIRRLFC